jgi:predicted TIM-barrel fold metal-dependent hydrolase
VATTSTPTGAAELRDRLDHPVVDADAHLVEHPAVFVRHLARHAGDAMVDRWREAVVTRAYAGFGGWTSAPEVERRRRGLPMPQWWAATANTLDRASASMPRLLHARLDELGIDFSILYPSLGASLLAIDDADVRRASCAAYNRYAAEVTADLGDRLTVAAVVPMHDPAEAVAELDHAVGERGARVVVLAGFVRRAVEVAGGAAERIDTFGIDSDHDYDAVWRRCCELGVAVTMHSSAHGSDFHSSPSRFVFNHIGKFSTPAEASLKSLVLGGVPVRFPDLRFAWMEAGVGWAALVLSALVDRWRKRGGTNIEGLDPGRVDVDAFNRLVAEYGDGALTGAPAREHFDEARPEALDDFRDAGVADDRELATLVAERCYFGCEADDRAVAWAFDTRVNPHATTLRPVLGSDIGHWDVRDASGVLAEAVELVEEGLVGPAQFRAFACDNAIRLHGAANPRFFDGTPVEGYARAVLDGDGGAGGDGGPGGDGSRGGPGPSDGG